MGGKVTVFMWETKINDDDDGDKKQQLPFAAKQADICPWANSFLRAKLKENCELRGKDNIQGQISEHIFKVKWRLLCLLSFI